MTYHLENNIKVQSSVAPPVSRVSSSSSLSTIAGSAPLLSSERPQNSNHDTTSGKQRVKVVVRVRPPIAEDYNDAQPFADCTAIDSSAITIRRNQYEERSFQVDHVLDQNASQQDVYDPVCSDIVADVLTGYNGTVLAYGQSGTGKSFTVFGPGTHWVDYPHSSSSNDLNSALLGLIPRAVHQIFQHIHSNNDTTEFRVTVSFMQIYMERVMDLLDINKDNLQIREDPKYGTFVDNITTIVVQEPHDVIMLIKEGAKNRAVGSTNMNKVSSRSHVILNITVEQRSYSPDDENAQFSDQPPHEHGGAVKRGTLTLVDLAGSERVGKSLSEGQSLEEAKQINKSLSALGNCVSALTDENRSHVPFRDSKLTKLLTDSLGGNAKTCLIATIGPAAWNYDETYSTLNFATRAMAVKNNARINETVDFKTLSGNLQKKISMIESEKYRLMARNVDLEREVEALRNTIHSIQSGNSSEEKHGASSQHDRHNSSQPHLAPNTKEWEKRERELVQKFTNIIHHLQMEIAKQNMIFASQAQGDGDQIIDQLVSGFLAIPVLKQKLLEKLSLLVTSTGSMGLRERNLTNMD
eukprot:CAMPEP_0117441560 /NCGR_PEP_ID=MMETSP0759-20121206/3697_1 /TAXON_ID=63605 /ORGANISM="Percolomonas cosmopolitus, Strain WS" /LENGTH=580 /DNA_ID=CAMNT_0005233417 /DNA_START=21 /DNA_END=1760 /DNA_ORIENTATION=+